MPGTHLLPPNLLKLFAPRPPLPYTRPLDRDIDRPTPKNVDGVAGLLARLNAEKEDAITQGGAAADAVAAEGMEEGEEPSFTLAEEVKREMRREERKKMRAEKFKTLKESYKPAEDPEAIGDPYKTLFIARVHKTFTEKDLRREFENYGAIERVRIVRDKQNRSRGYAFVVFERERDMKAAYKDADGLILMGKRVMIDVERGRTVRGWKPRRLGGGLGGRPKPVETMSFGGVGPVGGGDRGGGRGGFRGGFGGGGRGGGGDRGGFRGGRGGGFGDRGGFRGGGRGGGGFAAGPSDRGYGDRAPPGGGSFRGRDDFGPPGGGGGRGGFGGGDRFGGGGGGRGGGIGYQGGGFGGAPPPNGFGGPGGPGAGGPGGPPPGYGAPPNGGGYGPPGGAPAGGFGLPAGGFGGPPGGFKRENAGGFDDRDSKRPRY